MADQPSHQASGALPGSSRHEGDASPEQSNRSTPPKQKAHPRVKFTVGSDQEEDRWKYTTGSEPNLHHEQEGEATGPVPGGHLQTDDESEDVSNANVLKDPDWSGRTRASALMAQDRASRLASGLSRSAPVSRRNSIADNESLSQMETISPTSSPRQYPVSTDDIPMVDLESQSRSRRPYSLYEDSTDDDSDTTARPLHKKDSASNEASRIVRAVTRRFDRNDHKIEKEHQSGTSTPAIDQHLHDVDYVPPPREYKAGIVSSLMKLYDLYGAGAAIDRHSVSSESGDQLLRKNTPREMRHGSADSSGAGQSHHGSPGSSGHSSGKVTPLRKQKWYDEKPNGKKSPGASRRQSVSSLAQLLQSSALSAAPGLPRALPERPQMPRSRSSGVIATAVDRFSHHSHVFKGKPRLEDEIHITIHIADLLARQRFLFTLCRALMVYGAPTHRLEEYMTSSARVLQIEGQFLYLPGCMVMSFDDPLAHTTEVKLLKQREAVDLGKFQDTFVVYKNVIHDKCGVEEATQELEEIMRRPPKFSAWIRVLVYGIASVSVGPFAFSARPIDFPFAFVLGCLLGILQLIIAPRSNQFQHVFEVAAAVVTSFLARALGSIRHDGHELFCFAALAQSSIALILPGYIILCASLELQSRSIVAGSVRMVYAIIYSLFLGFGITIGTAIFGLLDPSGATSSVVCEMPSYWKNTFLTHWPFVPLFTLCLIVINQAKWSQAPAMLVIGFAGYQTNFWASRRFANNVQVANALGAFVIGFMANLYSRRFHGLAAAAMLPAIFVQVPSGLAASGSLVAGLTSANQLTGNATGVSVINNGTAGFQSAQNVTTDAVYGGTIFNVGYGMVQVAIGISVGLFLSALVVYPVGKRRSGLFSF